MNKRWLAAVLSCSLLGVSGLAHADDHHGNKGHGNHHGGSHHDNGHGHHGHDNGHGPRGHGGPPRHVVVENHYHVDAAPRRWSRGEYVPAPYRGNQYVVVDYRSHRLAPPPHGSHWIEVGSDYFLVGLATGVVLQSVLSN